MIQETCGVTGCSTDVLSCGMCELHFERQMSRLGVEWRGKTSDQIADTVRDLCVAEHESHRRQKGPVPPRLRVDRARAER